MTYSTEQLAVLDDACRLVRRWGKASFAAAGDPNHPAVLDLDGENTVAATDRWTAMVEGVRGSGAAAVFAAAAETYLQAQSRLGVFETRAAEQGSPVRWKAVGRAELVVELAEAALQEAAIPQARSAIEQEIMRRASA